MHSIVWSYAIWVLSAGSVCYILVGYPILLALCKGRRLPPVAKDLGFEPTVTAIVAVHNGGNHIRAKLETLLALEYPADRVQIVVVSDGSTDDTDAIAEEYRAKGVVLMRAPRGGKAAALNCGVAQATGEVVFFTDVRQPLNPGALRHLVGNLADPTVGAVTGELKLLRGDQGEQADMDLYWRYELWTRRRHSEIDSIFSTTGCIYAIRRELVQPIPPDTLTDDAVLALRAFFRGYRVIFDPAAIAFDSPAVAGTEFRRRFRTLAGLWQLHARFPQLFTARNRMRWHFLSYKFGRLALPWVLLVTLATPLAMPHNWFRTLILVCQSVPLALALVNSIVPAGSPLKRLTSPASTFLVMNAAALAAISVFFLPVNLIWKPTQVAVSKTKPLR